MTIRESGLVEKELLRKISEIDVSVDNLLKLKEELLKNLQLIRGDNA